MAVQTSPNYYFPGITVDADGIHIPLTAVPDVTLGEIDPMTGSAGVLMRGLVEGFHKKYVALPAADRPTRYSSVAGTQSATPNLLNALRKPYTLTFDVTAAEFEIAAEPTA